MKTERSWRAMSREVFIVQRSYLFNSDSKIENARRLILVMLYLQEIMPLDELLTDYEILRQTLIALSPAYQKALAPRREIRAELKESSRDVRSKQNLLERKSIKILAVMNDGQVREISSPRDNDAMIPLLTLVKITEIGKAMIIDDFWLEIEFSDIFRKVIHQYLMLTDRKTRSLLERCEAVRQSLKLIEKKSKNEP